MKDGNCLSRLSALGAWAVAFGCAVGWDVFVLPWTDFLPKAGPAVALSGLAVCFGAAAAKSYFFSTVSHDIRTPLNALIGFSEMLKTGFATAGEGLVKAIRADPALSGLRVVAVTADVEFRASHAEAGFDGILLKPVTKDRLAEMLSKEAECESRT